jgi:hypothetical protein
MNPTKLVQILRGIITSREMTDEHKIKAVRLKLTKADPTKITKPVPTKRGPYKTLKITEDFSAYLRKYRQERIAQGVCTCCGGINKDRIGKALCSDCLDSARVTARARKPLTIN